MVQLLYQMLLLALVAKDEEYITPMTCVCEIILFLKLGCKDAWGDNCCFISGPVALNNKRESSYF